MSNNSMSVSDFVRSPELVEAFLHWRSDSVVNQVFSFAWSMSSVYRPPGAQEVPPDPEIHHSGVLGAPIGHRVHELCQRYIQLASHVPEDRLGDRDWISDYEQQLQGMCELASFLFGATPLEPASLLNVSGRRSLLSFLEDIPLTHDTLKVQDLQPDYGAEELLRTVSRIERKPTTGE